jgi:hypothetical protein
LRWKLESSNSDCTCRDFRKTFSIFLDDPTIASVLAHLRPRREFAVQLWDGEQWHCRQSQASMVRLFWILLILDQGESEQHDDWAERGVDF